MSEKTYIDLGQVTAYAYAKAHGYTGTEEEFAIEQAHFAQNAQQVAEDRVVVREDRTHVDDVVETFTETTAPEAVQRVTTEGDTQVARVQGVGNVAVQDVTDTKDQALQDIDDAGESEVNGIQTEGNTQVGRVRTEGTTQVGNVNTAGTTQVSAVNQAGNTQVGLVRAEGTTQVQNVEDKGQEIIDALPPNYEEDMAQVEDFLENLVKVSETQPESEANKLWIEDQAEEEIEVPTYEEFESLSDDVADLKDAVDELEPSTNILESLHGMASGIGVDASPGDLVYFTDAIESKPIGKITIPIAPTQDGSGNPTPQNIRPLNFQTVYQIHVWNAINWIRPLNGTHFEDKGISVDYLGFGKYHLYGTASGAASVKMNTCPYNLNGSVSFHNTAIVNGNLDFGGTVWAFNAVNRVASSSSFVRDVQYLNVNVTSGETVDITFQPIGGNPSSDKYKYNSSVALPNSDVFQGSLVIEDTGKVTQSVVYKLYTFTGDEKYSISDSWCTDDEWVIGCSTYNVYQNDASLRIPACSHFTPVSRSYIGSVGNRVGSLISVWNGPPNGLFVFLVPKSDFLTLDDFKSYLKSQYNNGTPVQALTTPEANPIEYYSNVEQIITPPSGDTYVFCASVDVPRELSDSNNISVKYYTDLQGYIDRLTNPDADMIADGNISAGQYFAVGNNLFISTDAIAAGASIIPGTNCRATNLAEALNALNN